MLSIKIVFIFLYSFTKYFQLADALICDNAALQVCEGKPVNVAASPKPEGQFPIQLEPMLTFINVANVDENENTVTVFLSLALYWNDTRVNLSNNTEGTSELFR